MGNKAYEKVVNFLMDACDKGGRLPWESGLLSGKLDPVSYGSGKEYAKLNRLILGLCRKGTGEWATFNAIKAAGGNVRKGEHGVPVLGWYEYNRTKKRYATAADHGTEDDLIWLPRSFTVFEVGVQTDGLTPKRAIKKRDNPALTDADSFVEKFFKATNLRRDVRLGTACYSPGSHEVRCPALEDFKSSGLYYSTIFHEMVHSTMKKMGRNQPADFGSEAYSKEEVVAEVGALLLCERFGISAETRENSATYIQGWSRKLRENPDWLVGGASQAEKAVAYMLDTAGVGAEDAEPPADNVKDDDGAGTTPVAESIAA